MKLTQTDVDNLQSILITCGIGNVESFIIENGTLRGMNEEKSFAIISDHKIPNFTQKVGISRLQSLRQRMDLFAGTEYSIDAKETERGEISLLDIAAGKSKAQFRCTSTVLIKAPSAINDELLSRVTVTKDEMKLILNAMKVMGGKKVVLTIKKDETVQFQIADATNDSFTTIVQNKVEALIDGDGDSVTHYYPADVFSAVMRALGTDDIVFDVGARGIIRAAINGHAITLLPQIGDEGDDE